MSHIAGDVCTRAGITHRQLDHWCREGIIPGHAAPTGHGNWREFTDEEVDLIETAACLIRAGLTVRTAFDAAQSIRQRGAFDLWLDAWTIRVTATRDGVA